ncbi:MAG: MerR family transcriptional regulator [Alphaproteobacteria bacterium]|nr:MerR family transcriptional regulator [Alphaproteobacteria bacterium]
MDLIAAQETPNDFGDLPLHNDHHERKSSHAFRTISEVSDEIDVPQHVLRFWESKFAQIRPLKRGGGRRYYRPEDIELLKRIKNYLYKQGYTIKGVQRLLKEKRSEAVANFVPYANPAAAVPGYQMPQASQILGGPISVASYLQAAAAAPSALAMAYGLEFNFETPVVVEEKQAEGLSLLTLPLIPDYEVVASSAAPLEANVEAEAFEDEEFNQDSAEEEISVKRLDDACEAIAQEVATYVPLAAPVEARIEAPAIAPEKKEQLLGILAEMVALRDMLHAGI